MPSRKGFAADSIMLIMLIGIFMLTLVLGATLYNNIKDTTDVYTASGTDYTVYGDRTFSSLNYGSLILIIGMGIGLVITGLYIQTHPVIFVVYLIIFMFVVMMSGPMTNMFMDTMQQPTLAVAANQFDIGLLVLGNLPIFVLAFGIVAGVVIFAKIWGGS